MRQGAWNRAAGGDEEYFFFRQAEDVVVTDADGNFATIVRGGESNGWYRNAKPVE